jgi:iron complex transport system substrate-binding protein
VRTSTRAFCAVLLSGFVLASCGSDDGATGTTARAEAAAASYPVTIENCGRTLTFDKAPSRAVLSYHPTAEIFVGLGLADRAVGRAGYQSGGHGAATPAPTLPEQAADFKKIPVVSENVYPPTKERMLSLRPDFLLAYGDFDYSGDQGLASFKQLNAAGIQVYTVQCGADAPLSDIYRVISDLGKIFGVTDRAKARIAQMRKQIAEVQAAVAGEPPVRFFAYFGGEGTGRHQGRLARAIQAGETRTG